MSVTIDGIKGYEYQYKVAVLISLLYNADKINLFVEKEGSEDVLLIIENNGIKQTIEIQVKRESNSIDFSKLVKWLCHFPERRSEGNLLQRLFEKKDNFVLFITRSRCSDDIVRFKTDLFEIKQHSSISYSDKWCQDFSKSLKEIKFEQKTLKVSREQYCQDQSNLFKIKKNIENTLNRCLILEEFTDAKVDSFICLQLNSKFNIAQSRTNTVYKELLEIVKEGRDKGIDIYTKIMSHISINKIGVPNLDHLYKTRTEEKDLLEKLEKEGLILLTGASQCGKTELAKKIAIQFTNKGYDYQIFDEISELKRYFSSNATDNKIAILEDPWGHIVLKENYQEIVRKLSELISNIEKHHLLIVSSRVEILFEAFDTTSINDCQIKNHKWNDLTISDNEMIKSFWDYLANAKSMPPEIIETVSTGIMESRKEDLLQVGQLNYLVNEDIKVLTNKRFVDLGYVARRNSKEIARNLKEVNENASNILSIISICSSPIHSIDYIDLAYVLSSDKKLLSFTSKKAFTSTFGGGSKNPVFPDYQSDLNLNEDSLRALEYLEERQFIAINKKSIRLTHPNYYEAGRYLFLSNATLVQKEKLRRYKRCIACLNPQTAYQASKNLSFIYINIKRDLRNKILKIAFKGLNSIFPSVEDVSLIFLINHIQEIHGKRLQKLIQKIQSGGTSSSNIYWHNNKIPFISNESGIINLWMEFDPSIISKVENQLSEGILPTSYDSWCYIDNLNIKKQIPFNYLKILLQNNEAFIRNKLMFKIFPRLQNEDNSVLNDIFQDEHPSVVYNAIRASFKSWFSIPLELKESIFILIIKSIEKEQVSIRTYNFITTFSIDYGDESIFDWKDYDEPQKKELWALWGKLYPLVIDRVPLGVFTNTARFGATMDEAIKYLDIHTGVYVLMEWFKRIDYQIKNNKVLDEFEMAIADNLMQLTGNDFAIRKDIFIQLVNHPDTSFILSNLKWIIKYWDNLNEYEQQLITNLIHSNRTDVRWIKAVLLNSDSPPEEICFHILGEKEIFKQNPDYILTVLNNQLLCDCLNVYCGFPQPLWWLAVHHNNKELWDKIMRQILLNEDHEGFDICLEEFISYGVQGFSGEWKNWKELWTNICLKTKNKKLLFDCLLYNTADCTCNPSTTKILWNQLIESYAQIKKQEEIESLIRDNIEVLQQTGNKNDLFKIFGIDFLFKRIAYKLIPDGLLIKILDAIGQFVHWEETEIEELMGNVIKLAEQKNIRFLGTFKLIEKMIETEKVPPKVVEILNRLPNVINIVGKEELKKKKRFDYKLDNWVGIN